MVAHATVWPWNSVASVLFAPCRGDVGPAAWWQSELSVGGERAGRAEWRGRGQGQRRRE